MLDLYTKIILSVLAVLVSAYWFLVRKSSRKSTAVQQLQLSQQEDERNRRPTLDARQRLEMRLAQEARNRSRNGAETTFRPSSQHNHEQHLQDGDDDGDEGNGADVALDGSIDDHADPESLLAGITPQDIMRMGRKRYEKLRRKEAARSQRQAFLAAQEEREKERQRRDAIEEEERMEAEEKRLEAEKEALRKKEEEDKEWLAKMSVEAAGCERDAAESNPNGEADEMQELISFLSSQPIVPLEFLSGKFASFRHLQPTEIADRLRRLEVHGLLGVVDDRGRYVSLRPEQVDALRNTIVRAGRITVPNLLRETNRILHEA
jgi:hypothetical protein